MGSKSCDIKDVTRWSRKSFTHKVYLQMKDMPKERSGMEKRAARPPQCITPSDIQLFPGRDR